MIFNNVELNLKYQAEDHRLITQYKTRAITKIIQNNLKQFKNNQIKMNFFKTFLLIASVSSRAINSRNFEETDARNGCLAILKRHFNSNRFPYGGDNIHRRRYLTCLKVVANRQH